MDVELDLRPAVSFRGIHESDFLCSVLNHSPSKTQKMSLVIPVTFFFYIRVISLFCGG
jgi:hypothetical protein